MSGVEKSQPKKRKPDNRTIRSAKTYTVSDIAEALNRTEPTVLTWVAEGLPTIDSFQPLMIYGWQLRAWLHARWEPHRHKCAQNEFFCFGCREKRTAKEGTLEAKSRKAGGVNLKANCSVCGTAMHKGATVETAFAINSGSSTQTNEIQRFKDSDTSGDNNGEIEDSRIVSLIDGSKARSTPHSRSAKILPQNPRNERLKAGFFDYLHHCTGRASVSIRTDETAILAFEASTGFQDFSTFTRKQAVEFKKRLKASDKKLDTVLAALKSVQKLMTWLAAQPGYKRKILTTDIAFLNLTQKERNVCNSHFQRESPTVDLVVKVIRQMPSSTEIEKRNRALMAFLAITAVRIGALITLKLKHIELDKMLVVQDPREVKTKRSKQICTYFLPISDELETVVVEWVKYLRCKLGFSNDDPLFPATRFASGAGANFRERMISRQHWETDLMARRIIKASFEDRGHKGYTPHSFRNMVVKHIMEGDPSITKLYALSVNLGHSGLLTTLRHYGSLTIEQQGKLIREGLSANGANEISTEQWDALISLVSKAERGKEGKN